MDLDIGNYERYLSISLHKENHITTGKIYENVINAERRGDYLGKTVQVVPHVTDAIQDQIQRAAKISVDESQSEPDVCIIELGGTVGDIESSPFIHALAQLRKKVGKENFVQIHVSYIPIVPYVSLLPFPSPYCVWCILLGWIEMSPGVADHSNKMV